MNIRLAREASLRLATAVQSRCLASGRRDRGDMPGWVLIAVMTAGLVAIIYAAARGPIENLVKDALSDFR